MTTATKTKKAPPRLWVKTIDARSWHVECKSRTHFYHRVVRSLSTNKLICDSQCHQFRKVYTCPHVDRVHSELNPGPRITSLTPGRELWEGDEYSTLEAGDGPVYGDDCCYEGGTFPHNQDCVCPCHSVVPVPPPVKKLTLEDVFADYA